MTNILYMLILARLFIQVVVLFSFFAVTVHAGETMNLLYHPPESELDKRYEFHWQVLEAALEATKKKYGEYKLKPSVFMTEDRQVDELKKNRGILDVMIREASVNFEKVFVPVKIPIDRNLIGYRVLLIKKEDEERIAKINTIEDFKKLSMIQGQGWGDVDILKAAGFEVMTEVYYDKIFVRLAKGSVDAFPRGVTEVESEFDQRKATLSNLVIEPNILLYYPLPTYFWFANTKEGKLQAKRVEEGMNTILDNGKYEAIFKKHYSKLVENLKLKKRRLFKISNPYLPESTPFKEKKFWFDPTRDS